MKGENGRSKVKKFGDDGTDTFEELYLGLTKPL